jgi:hypothetical protein
MPAPAPFPDELDDEALAALLREAMMAGAPVREADLWLATVAAERVVDVLRMRGVRVLRPADGA